MSTVLYFKAAIALSVILFFIIDKALKGRVKKNTREDIEEKMFGK